MPYASTTSRPSPTGGLRPRPRLRFGRRVFRAGWIGLIARRVGFTVPLAWVEASVHSLEIGNGHARVDLSGFNRRMAQHPCRCRIGAPARSM